MNFTQKCMISGDFFSQIDYHTRIIRVFILLMLFVLDFDVKSTDY